MSDKALVQSVSTWIWKTSNNLTGNSPLDFYVTYSSGKPEVLPELRDAFEKDKQQYNSSWTDQDVFNNMLLGKEMFYSKIHGSCSSSAIYQATIFKALGIPYSIISTVPAADGNDNNEISMIKNNLKNYQIKTNWINNVPKGMANHFYNEVYVGNRWVRLNYDKLGQNINTDFFELTMHIDTFNITRTPGGYKYFIFLI